MEPILVLLALFVSLIPIVLLGRISHWTHATQQKLDAMNTHLARLEWTNAHLVKTNELLQELLAKR